MSYEHAEDGHSRQQTRNRLAFLFLCVRMCVLFLWFLVSFTNPDDWLRYERDARWVRRRSARIETWAQKKEGSPHDELSGSGVNAEERADGGRKRPRDYERDSLGGATVICVSWGRKDTHVDAYRSIGRRNPHAE